MYIYNIIYDIISHQHRLHSSSIVSWRRRRMAPAQGCQKARGQREQVPQGQRAPRLHFYRRGPAPSTQQHPTRRSRRQHGKSYVSALTRSSYSAAASFPVFGDRPAIFKRHKNSAYIVHNRFCIMLQLNQSLVKEFLKQI